MGAHKYGDEDGPAPEYREHLASSGPVNTEQTWAVVIMHSVCLQPQMTFPGLPQIPLHGRLATELQRAALPGGSHTCRPVMQGAETQALVRRGTSLPSEAGSRAPCGLLEASSGCFAVASLLC